MESQRFDALIERIRSGTEEEIVEVQRMLQNEASHDDIQRLESLLLNPEDNWLQDAIAVPYARLTGTTGLRTLLKAYQIYLGSYSESEDIQNLLFETVDSDSLGAHQVLVEMSNSSDTQLRENAGWLIEWSQAEGVENPLAHPPLSCRVQDAFNGKLMIALSESQFMNWSLQFSRVHAYRHISGETFRPLTRRNAWFVKLQDSKWARDLLGQAHMHPHPNPDYYAHYQLCVLDSTIDVLCSDPPEFREVRE